MTGKESACLHGRTPFKDCPRDAELSAVRAGRDKLSRKVDENYADLCNALQRVKDLERERDAAVKERDSLWGNWKDVVRQRDDAIKIADVASRQVTDAIRQRDAALSRPDDERCKHVARDSWGACRVWCAHLQRARDARTAAVTDRDQIFVSCQMAEQERDVARAARDVAVKERDEARAEYGRMMRERDEALRQRDVVVKERDGVKKELDATVQEREELIRQRDARASCAEWCFTVRQARDEASRERNGRELAERAAEAYAIRRDAALTSAQTAREHVARLEGDLRRVSGVVAEALVRRGGE